MLCVFALNFTFYEAIRICNYSFTMRKRRFKINICEDIVYPSYRSIFVCIFSGLKFAYPIFNMIFNLLKMEIACIYVIIVAVIVVVVLEIRCSLNFTNLFWVSFEAYIHRRRQRKRQTSPYDITSSGDVETLLVNCIQNTEDSNR